MLEILLAEPAQTVSAEAGVLEIVATGKAVGDQLRARVLRVLKDDSFGVLELCHIFAMAQPALSHHLKVLYQAGLVAKRREGTSIFYRRRNEPEDIVAAAVFAALDGIDLPNETKARIHEVQEQRREQSEQFFENFAAEFSDQQALISSADVYAPLVMDLIARHAEKQRTVLEVGPGDGEQICLLAESFEHVVGVDSTRAMLSRTAERTDSIDNIELLEAEFSELPASRRYDCLVAAMVVHHMPVPRRFFEKAAEIIEPGGLLVVAELCRHDQKWAKAACGDLWLGFEPSELSDWATRAGFEPHDAEFLAQKNGFRIQIQSFTQLIEP